MKRSSIVRTSEEDQYGRCTCEDDHVKPTPVDVLMMVLCMFDLLQLLSLLSET
jgi:hypothetical protein